MFSAPRKTILLLLTLLSLPGTLSANAIPTDAEELYVLFRYGRRVSVYLNTYFYADSLYLPLGETLRQLHIFHETKAGESAVNGKHPRNGLPFSFNYATARFNHNDSSRSLDTSRIITTPLEHYLRSDLFTELFAIHFRMDFTELAVYVRCDFPLPVDKAAERRQRRSRLAIAAEGASELPVLAGRLPSIISGAYLNYAVNGSSSAENTNFSGTAQGLLELLGGDMVANVDLMQNDNKTVASDWDFLWRYALGDNELVRQILLGDIQAGTFSGGNALGASVSNVPVHARQVFREHTFEDELAPGWESELYVDRRYIGFHKADSQETARFTVPLGYGKTRLQFRRYGPMGQEEEETFVISVPRSFTPPGIFDYTLSAGVFRDSRNPFAAFQGSYGLTENISLGCRADYDHSRGSALVEASLRARIGNALVSALDILPGERYRASASLAIGEGFRLRGEASVFAGLRAQEQSGRRYETLLDARLPFRLFAVPFALSARAGMLQNRYGSTRQWLQADLRFSHEGLRARGRMKLNRVAAEKANALYSGGIGADIQIPLRSFGFLPDFVNGTTLAGHCDYALPYGRLTEAAIGIERGITLAPARLGLSLRRDLLRNTFQAALNLSYDFGVTNARTRFQFNDGQARHNSTLAGSVAYDHGNGELLFSGKRRQAGAALSLRIFEDANANGMFDSGETLLPEASVRFDRSVKVERDAKGIIRVLNLQPYAEYMLSVDESTLQNPMWKPAYGAFSVVTDPNQIKPIDIPLVLTAIMEGRVEIERDGKRSPLPGATIHVSNAEGTFQASTNTFKDGSFYLAGVPAGDIRAHIDEKQLQKLRLSSNPPRHSIRVETSPEGAFIDGITFVLTAD